MLTLRNLKRLFIAVIGGTVLLLGVAMIVLPGPAFIVIPAGLGILALEFAWAKVWLQKTREYIGRTRSRVMRQPSAGRSAPENSRSS